MSITVIMSRPGVGKSTLAYDIFKQLLSKNKKVFFFSQERDKMFISKKIGENAKNFIFDDKNNFKDIINTIKDKKTDTIFIDYLQLFDKENLNIIINFVKQNNIDLYLISQIINKIPINQEPTLNDVSLYLKITAEKIIFLYKKENQVIKKFFNKN